MQFAFPYVIHTPFATERNVRFFATERAKPSLERGRGAGKVNRVRSSTSSGTRRSASPIA